MKWINSNSELLEQDHKTNPIADSLMHNFTSPLPLKLKEQIENNFYIYSKEAKKADTVLSNEILLPVIQDIIDFMMTWRYKDIESKRLDRKEQLWSLDEEKYIIIEKRLDSNLWDWKNLVQEICDILHREDVLWYIPLTQFFGLPVIEEKDFKESDIYYYKWISLNILVTRQIVCEWYKYFDEYLDYVTPVYDVARNWYSHGSRKYYKPFQDWYVLCINKERLQQHVASLRNEHNEDNEYYYNINTDDKDELYLYHSIVPISCVDQIIKVPWHIKPNK